MRVLVVDGSPGVRARVIERWGWCEVVDTSSAALALIALDERASLFDLVSLGWELEGYPHGPTGLCVARALASLDEGLRPAKVDVHCVRRDVGQMLVRTLCRAGYDVSWSPVQGVKFGE